MKRGPHKGKLGGMNRNHKLCLNAKVYKLRSFDISNSFQMYMMGGLHQRSIIAKRFITKHCRFQTKLLWNAFLNAYSWHLRVLYRSGKADSSTQNGGSLERPCQSLSTRKEIMQNDCSSTPLLERNPRYKQAATNGLCFEPRESLRLSMRFTPEMEGIWYGFLEMSLMKDVLYHRDFLVREICSISSQWTVNIWCLRYRNARL